MSGPARPGLERAPMAELARRTAMQRKSSEQKGHGRFVRAATPGLWRKNLSAEEQALVHDILGEKLLELGYAAR